MRGQGSGSESLVSGVSGSGSERLGMRGNEGSGW